MLNNFWAFLGFGWTKWKFLHIYGGETKYAIYTRENVYSGLKESKHVFESDGHGWSKWTVEKRIKVVELRTRIDDFGFPVEYYWRGEQDVLTRTNEFTGEVQHKRVDL